MIGLQLRGASEGVRELREDEAGQVRKIKRAQMAPVPKDLVRSTAANAEWNALRYVRQWATSQFVLMKLGKGSAESWRVRKYAAGRRFEKSD
jgi:hypothetical protein